MIHLSTISPEMLAVLGFVNVQCGKKEQSELKDFS